MCGVVDNSWHLLRPLLFLPLFLCVTGQEEIKNVSAVAKFNRKANTNKGKTVRERELGVSDPNTPLQVGWVGMDRGVRGQALERGRGKTG